MKMNIQVSEKQLIPQFTFIFSGEFFNLTSFSITAVIILCI